MTTTHGHGGQVSSREHRPRVALVTDAWEPAESEAAVLTRRVAAALTSVAEVTVVVAEPRHSMRDPGPGGAATRAEPGPASRGPAREGPLHPAVSSSAQLSCGPVREGPFLVRRVPVLASDPLQADLLDAALRASGAEESHWPQPALGRLELLRAGRAEEVSRLLSGIDPDVVLLAGWRRLSASAVLESLPERCRVVVLPLLREDEEADALSPLAGALARVATVLVGSEHEALLARRAARWLAERHPDLAGLEASLGEQPDGAGALVVLGPPLAVNPLASVSQVPGIDIEGYVLVLERWPAGRSAGELASLGPMVSALANGHPVVRVTPSIVIEEGGRAGQLSRRPPRMDLWRLMANARCMVDLGPSEHLGREVIESLLVGTPVAVPARGVRAAAAMASGGGLWWRDAPELRSCLDRLTDPAITAALGAAGRRWAEERYGPRHGFVSAVRSAVLAAPR